MVTAVSSSLQQSLVSKLSQTGNDEKKVFTKLATGKKTGPGTGETANLVKAAALDAAVRGLEVGSNNASQNSRVIGVAEGALQQTLSNLQSLRETAVQAADGTLSAADRNTLTAKAQETIIAVNTTAQQTKYDGQSLLDGSFTGKTVQTGSDAGQSTTYSIASATTTALGVNSIDVSTADGASSAITAIDSAITQVSSQLSTLGSRQQNFDNTQTSNNVRSENLQSTRSQLEDLDYAQAVGEIKTLQIKKQSQVQTLALLQTKDQNSLKLLA